MRKITIKAKKKKTALEDDSEWEEFGGEANRDSADFPTLKCHLKLLKGDYISSGDEDEQKRDDSEIELDKKSKKNVKSFA